MADARLGADALNCGATNVSRKRTMLTTGRFFWPLSVFRIRRLGRWSGVPPEVRHRGLWWCPSVGTHFHGWLMSLWWMGQLVLRLPACEWWAQQGRLPLPSGRHHSAHSTRQQSISRIPDRKPLPKIMTNTGLYTGLIFLKTWTIIVILSSSQQFPFTYRICRLNTKVLIFVFAINVTPYWHQPLFDIGR